MINDKEFEEEKKLNEENDYNKLLNVSKLSPYDEINLMLLNISHKYGESLEFQIQRKEINKTSIFDWIDKTLLLTHILDKKN